MVSRSVSFASCYISLSAMLLCNISCSASALIVVVELIQTFLVCCAYSCLACLVLPPLFPVCLVYSYCLFPICFLYCFSFALLFPVFLVYYFLLALYIVSSLYQVATALLIAGPTLTLWILGKTVFITCSHSLIVQRLPV